MLAGSAPLERLSFLVWLLHHKTILLSFEMKEQLDEFLGDMDYQMGMGELDMELIDE